MRPLVIGVWDQSGRIQRKMAGKRMMLGVRKVPVDVIDLSAPALQQPLPFFNSPRFHIIISLSGQIISVFGPSRELLPRCAFGVQRIGLRSITLAGDASLREIFAAIRHLIQ